MAALFLSSRCDPVSHFSTLTKDLSTCPIVAGIAWRIWSTVTGAASRAPSSPYRTASSVSQTLRWFSGVAGQRSSARGVAMPVWWMNTKATC